MKLNQIILHFRQHALRPDGKKVLKNNGGYTVLVKHNGQGYVFTLARCGKDDNFNKKIGTAIVEGRMKSPKVDKQVLANKDDAVWFLEHINQRTRERFEPKFFERLLDKLV